MKSDAGADLALSGSGMVSGGDADLQAFKASDVQLLSKALLPQQEICAVPFKMARTGVDGAGINLLNGELVRLPSLHLELLAKIKEVKPLAEWIQITCLERIRWRFSTEPLYKLIPERIRKHMISEVERLPLSTLEMLYESSYRECESAIASLYREGLILTENQIKSLICGHSSQQQEQARIDTLAIPTCNRSDRLKRCIESFAGNLRDHGRHDARILVVDDSEAEQIRSINKEIVANVKLKYGIHAWHFGRDERRCLVADLIRKAPAPPDVIRFALDPQIIATTTGAVRNTVLLLTSGSLVLSTDDDTYCSYAPMNSNGESVRFSLTSDPCRTTFYSSKELSTSKYPLRGDLDPFQMHERMLGKGVDSVIAASSEILWGEFNNSLLMSAQAGPGRIDITSTGASGDPGMSSNLGFIANPTKEVLQEVYSDPEKTEIALRYREVVRAAQETNISRNQYFQSMSFGINNVRLQPPFFPIGKNQDGAFSQLYLLASQESWICHLPFAVRHEPYPCRSYMPPLQAVSELPLTSVITLFFQLCSRPRCSDLGKALSSIGAQLVAFGSMPPKDFRTFLQSTVLRSRIYAIERLENTVNESSFRPKLWVEQVQQLAMFLEQSIAVGPNITPIELRHHTEADALAITQTFVTLYGKLLQYWEDIVKCSVSLYRVS